MEELIEVSARLQKIFEKAHKNCDCHYDPLFFKSVLNEFISVRMQIHHARKNATPATPVPYDLFSRATILRHRLRLLAPCRECIERYNPTGRKRSATWNPTRNRAFKEALR
jgi:hypothetical protein